MEPDFSSVWSRVTGATSAESPETQLRRFLLSEAEDADMLRTLLCQICDVCVRKCLTEVRAETLRQMKRLRAALYLLSGECECPAVKQDAERQEPLAILKALYERSERAAAEYRRAAAETDRAGLETIYASLAEAESRSTAALLKCTEQLLTVTCRSARP